MSVDFAVEVERIDVGHPREIVEHGHDAVVEMRCRKLVLARHLGEEQFAVGLLRLENGVHHEFEKGVDDAVTGQIHIEHLAAGIDAAAGHILAMAVGLQKMVGEVVDERTAEAPFEDFFFVVEEGLHASTLQGVDHAGAQIGNAVALVCGIGIGAEEIFPFSDFKEGQEELARLFGREKAELVGVFDVHHLIADVVGRLNEIHQRMAHRTVAGCRFLHWHAEFAGDAGEIFGLAFEEAEFGFPDSLAGGEGIFDDGGKRGIGHNETATAAPAKLVGEEAEGVGVAVEMRDIGPLGFSELFALHTDVSLQVAPLSLGEIAADGPLTTVAEGRVAHVVGQTGGRNDGANGGDVGLAEFGMARKEMAHHIDAQRATNARHLQAVCQSVMNENAARQREHLGLVLHPSEGRREDEAVEIALKFGALFGRITMGVFFAEALVGY